MREGISDTQEENDAVSAEETRMIFCDITAVANLGVKDKGVAKRLLFCFQGSLK